MEDVFSSPAVMLSLFEVQHSLADLMDADAAAGPAAAKAAAVAETQNRGGQAEAREQEHDLDLQLMNALYTALLKVHRLSLKVLLRCEVTTICALYTGLSGAPVSAAVVFNTAAGKRRCLAIRFACKTSTSS